MKWKEADSRCRQEGCLPTRPPSSGLSWAQSGPTALIHPTKRVRFSEPPSGFPVVLFFSLRRPFADFNPILLA